MNVDRINQINQQLQQNASDINALSSATPPDSTASTWWSVTSAMTMSSIVLLFGFLVILLATYLIRKGTNTEAVLRIFGTILIVVIAVFLVVAGYDNTQIAPVTGLLGTIVGYLLGKETRETNR